jgi:hypothetical protein
MLRRCVPRRVYIAPLRPSARSREFAPASRATSVPQSSLRRRLRVHCYAGDAERTLERVRRDRGGIACGPVRRSPCRQPDRGRTGPDEESSEQPSRRTGIPRGPAAGAIRTVSSIAQTAAIGSSASLASGDLAASHPRLMKLLDEYEPERFRSRWKRSNRIAGDDPTRLIRRLPLSKGRRQCRRHCSAPPPLPNKADRRRS